MRTSSIRELLADWVKLCEKSWVEKKREDFHIVNNHTNNLETEYNNLEIELGDINDYKILTKLM